MFWNDTDTPLAFFIAFRAYGTWLHGDKRGSVDRHNNRYGTPRIPRNDTWRRIEGDLLKHPPVNLDARRRSSIKKAIRETCEKRGWFLSALNIRTNHVHSVVAAPGCNPESAERVQSECNPENARGRMLAARVQSVGRERKQASSVE